MSDSNTVPQPVAPENEQTRPITPVTAPVTPVQPVPPVIMPTMPTVPQSASHRQSVNPFAVAGVVLAIIAYFTVNDPDNENKPSAMNKAMVWIAGLLSLLAIVLTPIVNLL